MTLTIGLVGSGMIARAHLNAWEELGRPLVMYSLDCDVARRLGARHGFRVVATLQELLSSCEIVDVCVPTDQHYEVASAAASGGKHVICEKPITRTAREASQLVELCERTGVRFFPAHVVRFFDEYEAAKLLLNRGEIGEPAIMHLQRTGARPDWSPWFADPQKSGGLLMDLMVHEYDIAAWFAGPISRVYATSTTSTETGKEIGIVILTHESGAISHLRGEWVPEASGVESSFQIYGSDGYLSAGTQPPSEVRFASSDGSRRVLPSPPAGSPFVAELGHFAECIETGTTPRVDAADGVAAVKVAEAAITSSVTRRAVEIEPAS